VLAGVVLETLREVIRKYIRGGVTDAEIDEYVTELSEVYIEDGREALVEYVLDMDELEDIQDEEDAEEFVKQFLAEYPDLKRIRKRRTRRNSRAG